MKKIIWVILILGIGAAIWFYYMKPQKQSETSNPPPPQSVNKVPLTTPEAPPPAPPSAKPTEAAWKNYSSTQYDYEISYPANWSSAVQMSGAFIEFGPGSIQIGGGDLALDMGCIYGGDAPPEGSNVVSEKNQVTFGANTFSEEKIFITANGQKTLSSDSFRIAIPAANQKNECPEAQFIVRKNIDQTTLEKILASFKFK